MNTFLYILIALLTVAVFGKWLAFTIYFPFMILSIPYSRKRTFINKLLAAPQRIWNKYLFRGGWDRWFMYEVAYIPSHHLRRFIYRSLGMKMGKNVVFYYGTQIRDVSGIQLGDGIFIGDNAVLDGRRGIIIGNNVNLSSNVSIWTLQHDHRDPDFSCKAEGGQVVIGDRVWLGSNVIVLPGVTIGEGAVCCAGCVVTKDVEPYSVVAGIPAKKVNERPRNLRYIFSDKDVCRLI